MLPATGNDAQQVLDFLEEDEEEFNFIADIVCDQSANNGVLKIECTNIDELWIHNEYEPTEPYCPCFKVFCKCVCNMDDRNKIKWDEITILVGNVGDDGTFYLLLEVQLDSYNFIFQIQAHDKKANKWMDKTEKEFIVNVPSFLFDIKYEKDEWVDFRKIGEYQPRDAQIIDILDNDMYKLRYDEYDESKDDESFIEKKIIVDLSRLYKKSINNQFVTRVHSPQRLENDLLIKTSDKQSITIFNTLFSFYVIEAVKYCGELYVGDDADKILIHYKPMAYFVSLNIFEFIFKSEFEFKVNCFINYYDGCMKLNTVRRNHIKLHIDHPIKLDVLESDAAAFNDITYTCDFCMIDMSEYDYYYSCDIDVNDKHDVCLNCVSRVIRLNAELKVILTSLLKDHLIIDCIDIIANFVIGGVRVIDFMMQQNEILHHNQQSLHGIVECKGHKKKKGKKRKSWCSGTRNKRSLNKWDRCCHKKRRLNNNL